MPRRSILSATERESLLSMPLAQDDLIRLYTFSDADLTIIGQHRGAANRLGFAVQLCYMRFPGVMLESGDVPPDALLASIASQLKVSQSAWGEYGGRQPQTQQARSAKTHRRRSPAGAHQSQPNDV